MTPIGASTKSDKGIFWVLTRMNSVKDKASKFHSDLVDIITFERIKIGTILIGGDYF